MTAKMNKNQKPIIIENNGQQHYILIYFDHIGTKGGSYFYVLKLKIWIFHPSV